MGILHRSGKLTVLKDKDKWKHKTIMLTRAYGFQDIPAVWAVLTLDVSHHECVVKKFRKIRGQRDVRVWVFEHWYKVSFNLILKPFAAPSGIFSEYMAPDAPFGAIHNHYNLASFVR